MNHHRVHRGGRRDAGRRGHVRCDHRGRPRVVWIEKERLSARLRSSPQRVARLREIRERPRISERLVVFSVHTSKEAYQDWCGTDRPRIIGQSTVEFTQPYMIVFELLLILFDLQSQSGSHASLSTSVLEYRSLL